MEQFLIKLIELVWKLERSNLHMLNNKVQRFIETYQIFQEDLIQQTQLQHRIALVESFQIEPGMRVLEIGCGQGDTTMVLADAVGEGGHVTAIDIASGDYGAPTTLAEAHAYLKASALGHRITFHVETDFINFEMTERYDVIVLSHCSWYFKSKEQLELYFKRMRAYCTRVCFAEWDLDFTKMTQRSHFCAVSILALYSTFVQNDGNIQNTFLKKQIVEIAEQSQFQIVKHEIVDASFLQDGAWEVDYANSISSEFRDVAESVQILVDTYYQMMNSKQEMESLNSFVYVFE